MSESDSLHASVDSPAMIVMAFSRIVALGPRARIVAPSRAAGKTLFNIDATVGMAGEDVEVTSRFCSQDRADAHASQRCCPHRAGTPGWGRDVGQVRFAHPVVLPNSQSPQARTPAAEAGQGYTGASF